MMRIAALIVSLVLSGCQHTAPQPEIPGVSPSTIAVSKYCTGTIAEAVKDFTAHYKLGYVSDKRALEVYNMRDEAKLICGGVMVGSEGDLFERLEEITAEILAETADGSGNG